MQNRGISIPFPSELLVELPAEVQRLRARGCVRSMRMSGARAQTQPPKSESPRGLAPLSLTRPKARYGYEGAAYIVIEPEKLLLTYNSGYSASTVHELAKPSAASQQPQPDLRVTDV